MKSQKNQTGKVENSLWWFQIEKEKVITKQFILLFRVINANWILKVR